MASSFAIRDSGSFMVARFQTASENFLSEVKVAWNIDPVFSFLFFSYVSPVQPPKLFCLFLASIMQQHEPLELTHK